MPQPPAPLRRVVARQAIVSLPHPLLSNKRYNPYTTSMMPSLGTPRLCRRLIHRTYEEVGVLGSLASAGDASDYECTTLCNSTRTKIISPLLGLLVAIFVHSTFNFLATTMGPVTYLFMFIVVLVCLVLIIVWLNFERRSIRDELREDVQMGVISPEEYAILPTVFRRRGYCLQLLLKGHLREWFTARRVHSTAVDLAYAKNLARRRTTPTRLERVGALRQQILDLKAQA